MFSTVRLEITTRDKKTKFGTAFIVAFNEAEKQHVPVLVTNKHVVEGAEIGKFHFTKAKEEDGSPDIGNVFSRAGAQFANMWVPHPEDDVDLCAMPIAPVFHAANAEGVKLFYRHISKRNLPDEEMIESLTAVENILMVGYPIGLSDEKNNLPIFRRGITASHPAYDYNGTPNFLIDAACFPGSSGSPIFLYDRGAFTIGGTTSFGERIAFLGVLHSGPLLEAEGSIEVRPIPTASIPISKTKVMINLGYVVKSSKVFEMEALFKIEEAPKNEMTPKD